MIPALFDAGHRVYSDGVEDDWGDTTAGWADPVMKKFITWATYATSEPKLAGHDRDVVDCGIIVYPPTNTHVPEAQRWFGDPPKPKDRIVIDGVYNPDAGEWTNEYEVIGSPERNDKAWWDCDILNWVINLRRVSG